MEVGTDPAAERFGLAYIKHISSAVTEKINPGTIRQVLQLGCKRGVLFKSFLGQWGLELINSIHQEVINRFLDFDSKLVHSSVTTDVHLETVLQDYSGGTCKPVLLGFEFSFSQ